MHEYGLTPGLRDVVAGTYGLSFVNRNAVAAAIEAPTRLSPSTVEQALRSMVTTHPALRMSLTDPSSPTACRQRIDPVDDALGRVLLVREDVTPAHLQERMSAVVTGMSEQLDVAAGITWGLAHLACGAVDHLVFVFNHVVCDLLAASQFIRTFVCSTGGACTRPSPPDTYLEHLRSADAEQGPTDAPDVAWWHARPWSDVGTVPGLVPTADLAAAPATTWTDVLDPGAVVTEHRLVEALDQSLRDITGLRTTRVDSAVHGRGTRVSRTAGGWLSHAVPYLAAPGEGSGATESTRARAGSWPAAFASVRCRPDLTTEDHLRAHVFVNFFGSLDPRRWSHDGYRLSETQPAYEPADRASLTPVRLRVNSVNRRWVVTWTVSAGFHDTGVSREIAERALKGLSSAESKEHAP